MIQHYRLNHFHEVIQSTSMQSETNQELISLLGKSLHLPLKKSPIPRTILYISRTDNELANIKQIQMVFRRRLAKILHVNLNTEDQKMLTAAQQRITLVCNNLINFQRAIVSSISLLKD